MKGCEKKLAHILRVPEDAFAVFCRKLEAASGVTEVMQSIEDENERRITRALQELGVERGASAEEAYDAIISKVEADDVALFNAIKLQGKENEEAARMICDFVTRVEPPADGLFLKEDAARQLLRAEPPKKILAALGYETVDDMLAHEDLLEVFSALRFLEDSQWLNAVFFRQYEKLTINDFERRRIQVRALNVRWAHAAEKFVAKKYHNVSHLKEMGVIFVIPVFLNISGETLRLVSLLSHYLNEVKYYSDLFEMFSEGENFIENVISLLRGDVIGQIPDSGEAVRLRFLVVQRYLAKEDEHDQRLFEPHVNPEAIHWRRAEQMIAHVTDVFPDIHNGLHFWEGLGWVGDYFPSRDGTDVLISFNIVDAVMGLVRRTELIKYLYHHQEALWNEIFIRSFSEKKMITSIQKNIIRGWFEV